MNETLIQLGGVYNILLVIFHLMFWRIFNWKRELKRVTPINSAIMQVLNICLTLCFVIFAHISLLYTSELLLTNLGYFLLISMSLFWLIRALLQIIFFKLQTWVSWVFLLYFLIGSALYGIPIFK